MVMERLRFALLTLACLLVSANARPGPHHGSGFLVQNHDQLRQEAKCGYESCPVLNADKLNVHLVPHTHDDVGWLKTLDQYYYGSSTHFQKAGVQYILDSVIDGLLKNPERKFVYVESAFFFKWWDEQSPELQEAVRELVQQGRLEFIGGAWSMNDEAAAHYQSLIDQFTWGLGLLNDTFGECGRPRAGWQIDPFGHSREQASLFAQMGYDGMFFARLDWRDKNKRLAESKAEMIWETSSSLADNELFTSVLYNHYSAPPGFCFDVLCSDQPFIDGKHSAENNVDQKVDSFLEFIDGMSQNYRSKNLLLTMGDDFTYMDANMYFKNLDKLIKYTNARQLNESNVNVFYSTPTCYLKALHDAKLYWPTKSDDFFPYASDPHAYWTGYYTSRPTSKRFERVGNHFLQVCKQLTALGRSTSDDSYQTRLGYLREAMGVMQHHDAITGTEKQHVADDYARMLNTAFEACDVNANDALQSFATDTSSSSIKFESCHLLNISLCEISETKETFVVTLYNPLGHTSSKYVRLPVNAKSYLIKDALGIPLPIQVIPLPEQITNLNFRKSLAVQELVFLAEEIPPLGYKSIYVTETYNGMLQDTPKELPDKRPASIGNNYLSLNFDNNGFLSTITVNGASHRLQQDFLYYEGAYGNNEVFENRSSGAYIFRPNGTIQQVTTKVRLSVHKGEHVQEVHQVFNEWVSQVIRVYAEEKHVEFEWLVGPIPVDDSKGKEVVTRFHSDIQSDGVFWTDSNGREMLRRVRNHRETWDLELAEPVAGNYYPITANIALEDDNLRMAVLNDRAQGGTSLQDGVLELMVHRRLLRDDAFGVGEALNEVAYGSGLIARGKHYLLFGEKASKSPTAQAKERFLQNQVLTPAWLFVSDATNLTYDAWRTSFNSEFSALSASLPPNVNLLTFEPWKKPLTYLVRFEHLLEANEDPQFSQPTSFNLQSLFSNFNIGSVRETTLAGNQWKKDSSRLKFRADPVVPTEKMSSPHGAVQNDDFDITLTPMEIRTFVIEMQPTY
ncbi:lysosomal alpha-mannosidase-like [Toxorhynchites rutilus septentrionalis]|uniref:lysosomal alpha-mannosidase-like n=1 Tax=Toxorhynchites rutilus septentrionalis TaxID=329112 RepID=UPI002479E5E4|nr:lysosomal alpha-mannosidase-like [Toxorhynchites rutilus septentrionalis]